MAAHGVQVFRCSGVQGRNRWLRVGLAAVLVVLAAVAAPLALRAQDAATLQHRIAAAERRGEALPIGLVTGHAPVIDGDLSEWGSLRAGGGCVAQGLDDAPEYALAGGKDAAGFKLLHDSEALYLAVRVVDSSIVTRTPYYEGDCIQLFLDVRPLSGAGAHLGDPKYTDGVYQLLIAAPTRAGGPVRWEPGNQRVKALGPFQIAGRALPDGYTLEMRIPFSSLDNVTAERLKEPIGFDLLVDDIDALPGGGSTPRAQYGLSQGDSSYQNPAVFHFVRAGYHSPASAGIVRAVPARYLSSTGSRRIVAGIITATGTSAVDPRVVVSLRAPEGAQEDPAGVTVDDLEYPALGVTVHRQIMDLQRLSLGKYVVNTHFAALPSADAETTFEAVSWRRSRETPRPPRPEWMADHPDLEDAAAGIRLPNGWRVTPVGRSVALPGDMPMRAVWSPDGRYLFVNQGGYHDHGVSVLDTRANRVVQTVKLDRTWDGMCLDPQSGVLYVSGGGVAAKAPLESKTAGAAVFPAAIRRFAWNGSRLSALPDLALPAGKDKQAWIGGLASGRGGALYVVNVQTDAVYRLGGSPLKVRNSVKVGYRPLAIALSPDGKQVAVTNWGGRSVSLLDAVTLRERTRIPVGAHPDDLAYGTDGRIFVANAGANTVSVISGGQVAETITTSLQSHAPVGSTPDALALSPDGQRLYVANAGNNDVAVVDVSSPTESRVRGFIPTGWYPSVVAVSPDSRRLYTGTGKGLAFRNSGQGQYIGTLLSGHINVLPAPDLPQLDTYTHQVIANAPGGQSSVVSRQSSALPTHDSRLTTPIRHVLYIIRENRTYDQVFGDVSEGNGDPSLTMFGADVTPNAHRLAHDYVLLDNLYCNGEVSEDGHEWCDAAYATDFTEKAWVNSYSDRGEPDADERLTASPGGYLWDNCRTHGLSYYSYGEFSSFKSSPKSPPVFTGLSGLKGHASLAWSQSSFDRHDTERVSIFLKDLHAAEESGNWPSFIVMSLGEDHTQGTSPGKYTPIAHVAANDQALGQIVEAVSHSRFWKDTAIFVIEDDAQDGPDHVDAHRTVGLVISPYIKRSSVDHTLYTTSSMVRTMEMLLGMPPMSQYDAAATPMTKLFAPEPDMTAYTVLPARVDMEARNPTSGPAAVAAAGLDFSHYDRVRPAVLNRMLWRALKPGVPQPAPVRSPALALARGR